MTREECVNLAKYVGDLFPQQRMGSTTGLAWHDVLGHLELGECKQAAAAINGRQPFVSPSEIITEIAVRRGKEHPHSQACRAGDCRACLFGAGESSWCMCACHPRAVQALTSPNPPPAPLPKAAVPELPAGPKRFEPGNLNIGRSVHE